MGGGTLRELLEPYLTDARDRAGVALTTVKTYRSHLTLFLDWFLAQNGRDAVPADFTLRTLQIYDTARKRRRISQRTRAACVCACRSWAKWLHDNQHIDGDELARIVGGLRVKVTDAARRPCATDEQVYAMFAACDRVPDIRPHRRRLCAAVLSVIAYAGLRRAEACALMAADVSLDDPDPCLTVRHGKGDKARTMPLHPAAVRYLRDWLEFRPVGLPDLFAVPIVRIKTGPEVVPLGDNRLLGVLRELRALSGTPKMAPHAFRRFFATRLLEVPGATIVDVQMALGHSSPQTTYNYISSAQGKLRKLVNGMVVGSPEKPDAPAPIVPDKSPKIHDRLITTPQPRKATFRR